MKEYLLSFNILTEEEINHISTISTYKTISKGDFFIQEGRVCQELAFITHGLLRSFYYPSSGEETTYCFTFPNMFLAAYSSFISGAPTIENIQALSDIEMISIPKKEIIRLENESTNWLRLTKFFAEQEYIKMENRIFLLQKEKAATRYQDLLIHHPEYLQMIPLNYLASYLGITQRHLSRIRQMS